MSNYTSVENQKVLGELVGKNIFTCETSMVDFILRATRENSEYYNDAPFNEDDVENLWVDNADEIALLQEEFNNEEDEEKRQEIQETIEELENEESEPKEVYEWWKVSSWFMEKLQEKEEVVIPHMNLWGRCSTGQAICLDRVIAEIGEDMEILEGMKNYEFWK